MSNYDMTALNASILAFAEKIKEIGLQAANAENAQRLEGLTLNEVVELIAGTTGLTIGEVKDQLDAFIARTDNPHGVTAEQVGLGEVANFGMATNAEALDENQAERYIAPSTLWHALNSFWAGKVGAAPETLDTIEEIADAISNNQDAITAINDAIANKATKTALEEAVSDLEDAIDAITKASLGLDNVDNFATATIQEHIDGVATDKFATPAGVKAAIDEAIGNIDAPEVTKAAVGLGDVENYGIATEAEMLETDPAQSTNEKYVTPRRVLDVRLDMESGIAAAFAALEQSFNDALAALEDDEPEAP